MSLCRMLPALGILLGLAACSTPAICAQSCRAWDATCGYTDYTYQDCNAECFGDADWTQTYADCVSASGSCSEIEGVCGSGLF